MRNDIRGMSDMLETAMVLRSAKNLFFTATFLSLLVLGAIFAFSRFGIISFPWDYSPENVACSKQRASSKSDCPLPSLAATLDTEQTAAAEDIRLQAEQAVATIELTEPVVDADILAEEPSEAIAEDDFIETVQPARWQLSWFVASALIRLANAVVVISLTLYSLTLLICLKVTLVGRLGAAYSITSAMLYALFAAVVFMPWQAAFPMFGLTGAIFTPYELACATIGYEHLSRFCKLVFYIRYAGLWILVVVAVVVAQFRSIYWASKIGANTDI